MLSLKVCQRNRVFVKNPVSSSYLVILPFRECKEKRDETTGKIF